MRSSAERALFAGGAWGRVAPALVWTALILTVNSIPGDRYPEVRFRFADKWVHAALYLPVGFLYARALMRSNHCSVAKPAAIATAAGVIVGAVDELHQRWIPRRTSSMDDWIVDAVAVACGVAVYLWLFTRHRRRAVGKLS
jgi:VanZ family protein